LEKFERNVERDAENEEALRELGWSVLTVWECELNDDPLGTIEQVIRKLDSQVQDT
jgi:DNA mismatch endonuclease (patch repair protein)